MKSAGPVRLTVVLLTIAWVSSMPAKEATTRRPSQPQIGDTIKQLTSQLMNVNATKDITLDTRTPPKVKQQMKKPPRKEELLENSHPGVAVPVEDADLILEESTKKFSFYKIENKPTTDRGLSTWVLLNSQTVPPPSSTTKAPRKPTIKQKQEENKNATTTDADIFNKITKPLFKKRPLPTTTRKPTTISVKTSTVPEKEYKLTKIKASELTNAINSKNKTQIDGLNKKSNATTVADSKKENSLETGNMQEISTIKPGNKVSTTMSISNNELIPLEAKDDEIELITTTASSKKTRRPGTKRKKTKKQKRPRPSIDKSDTNSTKLVNKIKDKPISTQIYNYLSREIIPTVGVGLVGLMVTAGLASYFLYPFGVARRSYEVDRKDKEGSYYYRDEYAPGGVAEEEVIGKVIAGMPTNSNYPNYRSPTSRDAYSNIRHKENDFGFRKTQAQSSVEAIYLTPSKTYSDEEDIYVPHRNHKTEFYNPQRNYNKEVFEHNQETGYTVEDKQFVVGSVPKEIQEVTPAVVPEHGPRNLPETTTKEAPHGLSDIVADYAPRSLPEIFEKKGSRILKVRKRRSNDLENEILTNENEIDNRVDYATNSPSTFVTEVTTMGTDSTTTISTNTSNSFINLIKNYLEVTIKSGLEILRSTSRALSRYFAEVQRRFNSNTNNTLGKEQPRRN